MAKCIGSSTLACPKDTYLLALARSHDNVLATIGSDNSLRLFDTSLKPLHAGSHDGVACLKTANQCSFVTAGRDGLIRGWDRRATKAVEIADPKRNGYSSIACYDNLIAAGNDSVKEGLGDVSVDLYDIRNSGTPLRQYSDSHTDAITQLAFHPSHANILLSGSTDGLVSIFDVNHQDEEDALQQVLNPRSAIHCAGFLAQDQVYVVSTDEHYSVHTLAKTAAEDEQVPPPIEFGDVREKLQCMYVIDVLMQPDGPPLMAYGHNVHRALSIVSLGMPGSWAFGEKIDLPGAHDDEVVRDVLLHDSRAFTCGEDGTVKVWSLGQ